MSQVNLAQESKGSFGRDSGYRFKTPEHKASNEISLIFGIRLLILIVNIQGTFTMQSLFWNPVYPKGSFVITLSCRLSFHPLFRL